MESEVKTKDKKNKFEILDKSDDLYICSRCGTCLAYCPIYKQTLNESFSPRGKMSLLEAINKGKLKYTDKVSEKLFTCTTCNLCKEECPSGVKLDEMINIAKSDLIYAGKYPEVLDMLKKRIKQAYNITFDSNAGRLDWTKQLPESDPEKYIKKEADVVYFVGCVSSFSPRSFGIPRSIVQDLDSAKVSYTLLGEEEWCCGFPLISSGIKDVIGDLVKHNIEAVKSKNAKLLVLSCPSCYHTWKYEYNKYSGKEIDFEILHISQYLLRLIKEGKIKLNSLSGKVTYHDPCDLGRNSGIYEEPREVIKSIPGLDFIDLPSNRELSNCCGGGGNLESINQTLASKIALAKADEIIETKADIVITSCQQCNRTIDSSLKKKKKETGTKVKVMDLPELVLQSIQEQKAEN
ncbi:MAG: (Fe-S)-binding protein [Actinomycetota bacterium]|nr:(Fe-S)-binding protein [Actinomycetota bacterium]